MDPLGCWPSSHDPVGAMDALRGSSRALDGDELVKVIQNRFTLGNNGIHDVYPGTRVHSVASKIFGELLLVRTVRPRTPGSKLGNLL